LPATRPAREGPGWVQPQASFSGKAYGSYANFEAIEAAGAEPFIAFKKGSSGKLGGALLKAFHYFSFMRETYLAHYHKRSNVETVFSAVKRKFFGEVRSKTDTAMKNEVLAKLVAHNLCCLIQEQHELGIEPLFWQDAAPADTAVLAV